MVPPDIDLLRDFVQNRDDAAFAELVRRHIDVVYRAAIRKMDSPHLAEEVTQAVFTALASKAPSLLGHQTLIGWLHTATRFAAHEALRTERRRRHHEQEAARMSEHAEESTGLIPWERLRPVIDDALGGLSEADREAVLLRYFADLPFSAVGAALNLSENAARMRVGRALDKLQVELEHRGVTSTQAALAAALAVPASVAAPSGLAATVAVAALAGSTSTGIAGLPLGLLHFMNSTKLVASATGVVAALAIGAALYQRSTARETQLQLASARSQQEALQARLTATENRAQSLAAELASAQRPAAGAKPATTMARSSPPSIGASLPAQLDYALRDPAARAAYLQSAALAIKARYERFFQIARLTGEEQDRFLRIAMDDVERRLDTLRPKLAAEGLLSDVPAPTPSELQAMAAREKQQQRETGQKLRELMGDRVAIAVQYASTLAERNVAGRLATQLYFTDAPLTGPQADQLTDLLAHALANKKSETAAANAMGGKPIASELLRLSVLQPTVQAMPWLREAPVTDGVLERAAGFLSPAQVVALKLIQAQQVAELQLTPPRPQREGKK